MGRMTGPPTEHAEALRLYDAFDDAGRAWLDEVVDAFNHGGYTEAVQALLADEEAEDGADDE